MDTTNIKYDCLRGCVSTVREDGGTHSLYKRGCCKLSVFNWLGEIPSDVAKDLFEVRFKNTRKSYYRNDTGIPLKEGDLVVVEAANGHDLGIITLCGPVVLSQFKRHNVDSAAIGEFRKIFRKAKATDIDKWQEAISREHKTMIKSRQISADIGLNMKIGDVEYQGDGTKAIFYYIADERVDFRQLIRVLADEFRIRIEMKQIGARQEAALIGGLGVCGQELCCSRFMSEFKSITTQAARIQDLSLNPQKLAGQCSKLKCCINYEATTYLDAHTNMPHINAPLETEDGPLFLVKTDTLKGIMWFSYEKDNMINMFPLEISRVKEIISMNRKGIKAKNIAPGTDSKSPEFMSAVGEDSISRFDGKENNRRNPKRRNNRGGYKKRGNNNGKK